MLTTEQIKKIRKYWGSVMQEKPNDLQMLNNFCDAATKYQATFDTLRQQNKALTVKEQDELCQQLDAAISSWDAFKGCLQGYSTPNFYKTFFGSGLAYDPEEDKKWLAFLQEYDLKKQQKTLAELQAIFQKKKEDYTSMMLDMEKKNEDGTSIYDIIVKNTNGTEVRIRKTILRQEEKNGKMFLEYKNSDSDEIWTETATTKDGVTTVNRRSSNGTNETYTITESTNKNGMRTKTIEHTDGTKATYEFNEQGDEARVTITMHGYTSQYRLEKKGSESTKIELRDLMLVHNEVRNMTAKQLPQIPVDELQNGANANSVKNNAKNALNNPGLVPVQNAKNQSLSTPVLK